MLVSVTLTHIISAVQWVCCCVLHYHHIMLDHCLPSSPPISPFSPSSGGTFAQPELHQHQGELGGATYRQPPRGDSTLLPSLPSSHRRGHGAPPGVRDWCRCHQLPAGGPGEVDSVFGVGEGPYWCWAWPWESHSQHQNTGRWYVDKVTGSSLEILTSYCSTLSAPVLLLHFSLTNSYKMCHTVSHQENQEWNIFSWWCMMHKQGYKAACQTLVGSWSINSSLIWLWCNKNTLLLSLTCM